MRLRLYYSCKCNGSIVGVYSGVGSLEATVCDATRFRRVGDFGFVQTNSSAHVGGFILLYDKKTVG